MPSMLIGFHEAGNVDVAEIYFPTLANTNYQWALVNAADGPHLANELNYRPVLPNIPSTRAIQARYPQAFESGRVSIAAARSLPAGGQRFVLVDIVTDGCRACQPVATSLRYIEFSQGRLSGSREVGWQPWQNITIAEAAGLIQSGDVATIQSRLNAMGYQAGAVDGAAGPRTMAAFMSFKRDHCMPEDNSTSGAFAALLAPVDLAFPPAPCGPGRASVPVPDLPFPDGVYSTDAQLCPPASSATLTEFGDRAYSMVVSVENGSWSWGESRCTIRQATAAGAGISLSLDCVAEGTPQQSQLSLDVVHDAGFSYHGDQFWQCQAPAPELPLPAGTYAHDARLCPGSVEQAPNDVVFEAGARPLFIDGSDFAWDHTACRLTSARQAGIGWGLDLACVGENQTFETTQLITLLSDTIVDFDGFVREWCGPVIAP